MEDLLKSFTTFFTWIIPDLKVVGSNLRVTSLNPLKGYGLPFQDLTIKYDFVFYATVRKAPNFMRKLSSYAYPWSLIKDS